MRSSPALRRYFDAAKPVLPKPAKLIAGSFKALDNGSDRAVHVTIYPRPRTLLESRQIVLELQKYGEVEVFRYLKYSTGSSSNSASVIYKDTSAAAKALRDETIQFQYANSPPQSSYSSEEQDVESHDADTVRNQEDPYLQPGTLSIRKDTFNHLLYNQRQMYYWSVNCAYDAGNPGEAILGNLPEGLKGLRDFNLHQEAVDMRTRRQDSVAKQQATREKGWSTLNELWQLGEQQRLRDANTERLEPSTGDLAQDLGQNRSTDGL